LESEIDPARINQRALVEGNHNRQTQKEIAEAVAGALPTVAVPDPETAFRAARQHLEEKAAIWDWADDVEFLGLSWVVFR